ncbi:MAG: hypothetical protein IKD42_01905, partial [Kiritimatiellae bacterium]|nr:hypothetical protein [Kiritimatiellia bacterium]
AFYGQRIKSRFFPFGAPESFLMRWKCLSNQQSAIQRPVGRDRKPPLYWLLRCWLLAAGTLRPQAASKIRSTSRQRGERIFDALAVNVKKLGNQIDFCHNKMV